MAKAKKGKEPVGRPTKYQPAYAEQAYKLCLLGSTDADMASFFNVSESTINLWKLSHIEFSESIRDGKKIADMEVASSLYKGAIDRVVTKQQAIKVKEIKYNEQGKKISEAEKVEIVELEDFLPSDFRNAQFWLKNRHSDIWRDKQEFDHTSQGDKINSVTIFQLPDNGRNE